MANQYVLGIGLEVTAAALGTVSKQMIASTENMRRPRLKRGVLGMGIFLNVLVGPLVDATAYAFAPQTVIAPFASLDVIFNACTAPLTLQWQGERLTWKHLLAALLVTGGASLAAVFGQDESSTLDQFELNRQLLRWHSLVYFIVEGVVVMIAVTLIKRDGRMKGLALGGVAGVLMGNVFLVKGFVGLLRIAISDDDWSAFETPTPWVLLFGAVIGSGLGTFFMQSGLRKYKGVYMVTIFEGMHITTACLSGDIVMSEMSQSSWRQYLLYWASISCIIGGIALINYISTDVELDVDSVIGVVPSSFTGPGSYRHPGMIMSRSSSVYSITSMVAAASFRAMDGTCDEPLRDAPG